MTRTFQFAVMFVLIKWRLNVAMWKLCHAYCPAGGFRQPGCFYVTFWMASVALGCAILSGGLSQVSTVQHHPIRGQPPCRAVLRCYYTQLLCYLLGFVICWVVLLVWCVPA